LKTPTLFARASGSGRAGVAVFRITGPLAGEALSRLTGGTGRPRYARRVEVRDLEGSFIDDGLALWFPAPNSFTGEDVVELQLHGSPAVAARLAEVMQELGIQQAGPGEFTMRAFANGKLDLTQAEGLAELLEAETVLQHKQATANFRGALRDKADGWRADLIAAMAVLDAAVDFPDEDDVPADIASKAQPLVDGVMSELSAALEQAGAARKIADGLKVVIVGPPNAGKSSLFNRLLNSERALVSAEAGTTRDYISARLDWAGYPVELIDTAGMRQDAMSSIEEAGIGRAREVADGADLCLVCLPTTEGELEEDYHPYLERGLLLWTKADLGTEGSSKGLAVSTKTGSGLVALQAKVVERLEYLAAPGLAPTNRQQGLILEARDALSKFASMAHQAPEAGAEAVRSAARSLEVLTGRIAPDDILDDIFSSFCIGK